MKAVLAADYYSDFNEAAKQLNCSRAILVRNVHNAEEKLGGPLFEKRDARMSRSLTPLGRRVIPCLQEIVHTHAEMLENIEKLQERVENRLTVGISSSSQNNPDTIRLLTELIRLHPQIEISDVIRQSYVLEQMLFARHMYIAMSDKHPLAGRSRISLRELRGETLFFNQELRSEVYGRHRVREFFANSGEDVQDYAVRYLDFINNDFLFRLVSRGEGMLPRVYPQSAEGVSFVPVDDFTTHFTTVMAAHRMVANPNKQLFLKSAKKLAAESGSQE